MGLIVGSFSESFMPLERVFSFIGKLGYRSGEAAGGFWSWYRETGNWETGGLENGKTGKTELEELGARNWEPGTRSQKLGIQ